MKAFFLALLIALPASAAQPKIAFPLKINRYAFTGEHFMLKDMDSAALFEKLLLEGHLTFKAFHPQTKIENIDWNSRSRIGQDEYEFSFPSAADLHKFASEKITDPAPYNFSGGDLSYGLLISVRDYAIRAKDLALIGILLEKTKKPRYEGSANEGKDKIYKPLRETLARLKKEARASER